MHVAKVIRLLREVEVLQGQDKGSLRREVQDAEAHRHVRLIALQEAMLLWYYLGGSSDSSKIGGFARLTLEQSKGPAKPSWKTRPGANLGALGARGVGSDH